MIRTRFSEFRTMVRILAQTAAVLAVAGCVSTQSPDRVAVEIKGSDPAATAPAAPASTVPDARGIVAYDGYQAAVARSGDTVASVARRIGLSASELGAYNGLSPTHPLRSGDELVLPPRPGAYSTGESTGDSTGAAPDVAPRATTEIAQGVPAAAPAAATDPATNPIKAVPIEAAPLQTGPAATDPVAADPAASAEAAWSPDLAAAAIDRAAGFDAQGELAAPPSAEEPLPPSPQAPGELASPQLRQYQTPALEPLTPAPPPRPIETITTPEEQIVEDNAAIELAATAPEPPVEFRLIRPVVGPVVIGFNQGAGRARNDGIDFASPSGAPVVAAAAGEVALVSQSLGGLGTIVLLRHPGDYLTVYGRIERVTVVKGDFVSQGQKIGVVSPATQPRMHFEVRHGAESLDPVKFF
ncbi:MAG: LysM peptidoglycan-binding domain-containing M23 family metallopeptidase [Limibaculum sp.]